MKNNNKFKEKKQKDFQSKKSFNIEKNQEKGEEENKDKSPYVYQRDKIGFELSIRNLEWTEKQKRFIELALDKNTRLMLIKGPAGTSKTMLAVYAALHLLNSKKVSDIIYLRSAVESSEASLGFLPGTADEKLAFYNLPFWDKLTELLDVNLIKKLNESERIHCFPINFIRGLNWNAKAIILDEAQNSSYKEIVTSLTRLGHFSRCFILADPMQADLKSHKCGGFSKLYDIFANDQEAKDFGIHTFEFTSEDVKRSELAAFLVKKLEGVKID